MFVQKYVGLRHHHNKDEDDDDDDDDDAESAESYLEDEIREALSALSNFPGKFKSNF